MRILFATDGSRGATVAEDFLLSLPLSCADEVTVVTAYNGSEREAFALLSRSRWRFAARDVPAGTALRLGHAADAAQAVALERGCDLLVIGSRGRGELTGAVLGSVARSLVHTGLTPLLVVRSRREAPRRVLLVIDGSTEARVAVDILAQLPLPLAARIDVLQPGTTEPERSKELVLEHTRMLLGERIDAYDTVDGATVGEAVTRHALDASADIVVLGTDGQTHGVGLLRSSLADHVVAHAHCAVLVARRPLVSRRISAAAVLVAS